MRYKTLKPATYIYVLRHKNGDGPRYVGSTRNPDKRLYEHKYKPMGLVGQWIAAVGEDSIRMDVVEETSEIERYEREQAWIDRLTRHGYDVMNIRMATRDTPFSRMPPTCRNTVTAIMLEMYGAKYVS